MTQEEGEELARHLEFRFDHKRAEYSARQELERADQLLADSVRLRLQVKADRLVLAACADLIVRLRKEPESFD